VGGAETCSFASSDGAGLTCPGRRCEGLVDVQPSSSQAEEAWVCVQRQWDTGRGVGGERPSCMRGKVHGQVCAWRAALGGRARIRVRRVLENHQNQAEQICGMRDVHGRRRGFDMYLTVSAGLGGRRGAHRLVSMCMETAARKT
jgi:hypothetical protein